MRRLSHRAQRAQSPARGRAADRDSGRGEKGVPIKDDEAYTTYWLGARTDAPERIREIFELMRVSVTE